MHFISCNFATWVSQNYKILVDAQIFLSRCKSSFILNLRYGTQLSLKEFRPYYLLCRPVYQGIQAIIYFMCFRTGKLLLRVRQLSWPGALNGLAQNIATFTGYHCMVWIICCDQRNFQIFQLYYLFTMLYIQSGLVV